MGELFTITQLQNHYSLSELLQAKFSESQLKDAGFTASQFKDSGFTASQFKDVGFTVSQLKDAGIKVHDFDKTKMENIKYFYDYGFKNVLDYQYSIYWKQSVLSRIFSSRILSPNIIRKYRIPK